MDKEKVNQYLDSKIKWYSDRLEYSKSLDDSCIGKYMFIECESQLIQQFEEIKAFINSGLADKDVEH